LAVSLREKLRDVILDLTLSKCKDTTELISENMDHNISVFKRWRMGFHLALCEYCREYKAQLETLRQMALGLDKESPNLAPQASLKPDSKEKLQQIIEENN
jgi:predicted anti-sigma-YlaC factor YlaD